MARGEGRSLGVSEAVHYLWGSAFGDRRGRGRGRGRGKVWVGCAAKTFKP